MEPAHTSIPSQSSSNLWTTDPQQSFNELKNANRILKKPENKTLADKALSSDVQQKCIRVLNDLSTFLDEHQFDQITTHPLLLNAEFYDAVDQVDGVLEGLQKAAGVAYVSLFDNPLFSGCLTISDKLSVQLKPASIDASDSQKKPENENSTVSEFNWSDKSASQMMLETLKKYSLDLNGLTNGHVKAIALECAAIFDKLKDYLNPLQPILDCKTFKDIQFFDVTWAVCDALKDHVGLDKNLRGKVDKLAYFVKPIERNSRVSSATSSAAPSHPASAQPSPQVIAAQPRFAQTGTPTSDPTGFHARLSSRLAALPPETPSSPGGNLASYAASPAQGGVPPTSPLPAPSPSNALGLSSPAAQVESPEPTASSGNDTGFAPPPAPTYTVKTEPDPTDRTPLVPKDDRSCTCVLI